MNEWAWIGLRGRDVYTAERVGVGARVDWVFQELSPRWHVAPRIWAAARSQCNLEASVGVDCGDGGMKGCAEWGLSDLWSFVAHVGGCPCDHRRT